MTKRHKHILIVVCSLVAVCLLGVLFLMFKAPAGGSGKTKLDKPAKTDVPTGPESGTEYVTINGVKCTPKQNIKTYLFMGIDNTEEHGDGINIGGQADVLRLLVVDRTAGTYTQLPINRNTMMNVGNYDAEGEYICDSYIQVSYAHMGGDGGGDLSCQNTVNAVSDFLYGQKIDGYIAVNMEEIGTINHLAGGVTVKIEDDFSNSDPSLKIGDTVKLTDEQAFHYVHDRKNVGDGTNECRMRRQDAFVSGLKDVMFEKMKADETYIYDVFRTLSSDMNTNMTEEEFGKIANALTKYEPGETVTITGTNSTDEYEYVTFTADEDSVADAVIKLFYRVEE